MEQVMSRAEIARVARQCWDEKKPSPYPLGSAAHAAWSEAYALCAAEELGSMMRATRQQDRPRQSAYRGRVLVASHG